MLIALCGCGHGKFSSMNPDEKLKFSQQKCDEGVGGACDYAGGALFGRKQYAAAFKRFVNGCEHGHGNACANASMMLRDGDGMARDPSRAADFAEEGCTLGDGKSCGLAGDRYERGDGRKKDLKRSVELFERGCQLRSTDACYSLGVAYAWGRGVKADQERAINLYKTVCDAGEAGPCKDLAGRYYYGRGVPRDLDAAEKFGRLACERGSGSGCGFVAASLEAKGSAQVEVRRFEDKACTLGDEDACKEVLARDGVAVTTSDEVIVAARRVMREARAEDEALCERKNASSCSSLGQRFLRDDPPDYRRALELFEIACDLGWGQSCGFAAHYLGHVDNDKENEVRRVIPLDEARALRFATKGCEDGHGWSCVMFTGLGYGAVSLARMRWGLERACALSADQCWRVVKWRRYGVGGPSEGESDVAAADVLARQCDADDYPACRDLQRIWEKQGQTGRHSDVTRFVSRQRARCGQGDQDSCDRIFYVTLEGWGEPQDTAAAVADGEKRCANGVKTACIDLAARYYGGDSVERDLVVAKRLYERACSLGSDRGCANVARLLRRVDRSPAARHRAFTLTERACRANDEVACLELVALRDDGEIPSPDPAKVFDALESAAGRFVVNRERGIALRDGLGTAPDRPRAVRLLSHLCAHDSQACVELGQVYEQDPTLVTFGNPARDAFALACALNNAEGCARLDLVAFDGSDFTVLQKVAQQCIKARKSCHPLIGKGRDPRITEADGFAAVEAACVDAASCNEIAFRLLTSRHFERAASLARRSLEHDANQPVHLAPDTLANALLQAGRLSEARQVLEEALRKEPTDKTCRHRLQDVAYRESVLAAASQPAAK